MAVSPISPVSPVRKCWLAVRVFDSGNIHARICVEEALRLKRHPKVFNRHTCDGIGISDTSLQ